MSTMSLPPLEVRMATNPSRTFADFAAYMLGGEHWRLGKKLNALREQDPHEPEPWQRVGHVGFHMHATHRQGAMVSHVETSQTMDEFLQARIEAQATDAKKRQTDHERVQRAIAEVRKDRPDEMKVLGVYLIPEHRRGSRIYAVAQTVGEYGVGERTMRSMRDRALQLVWDELGGLW